MSKKLAAKAVNMTEEDVAGITVLSDDGDTVKVQIHTAFGTSCTRSFSSAEWAGKPKKKAAAKKKAAK